MNNRIIVASRIFKKEKNRSIFFADLETCIIKNTHFPICIGALPDTPLRKAPHHIVETVTPKLMRENPQKEAGELIQRFFNRFDKKDCIIYFHNLGRFDAYILVKYLLHFRIQNQIERDRVIYSLTFTNTNGIEIELRDSYLITNTAIDNFMSHNLATKRKVENKELIYKKSLDFLEKDPNLIINLMKTDIEILKEGMSKIRKIIKEKFQYNIYINALTIANITFNIFLNKYNPEEVAKGNFIYKLTVSEDAWIRESYMGGVTEVYKPYAKEGYVYDINSAYPYVMAGELPIGKPTRIKNVDSINIKTFFGFVKAIVYVPETIKFPPLMIKHPERGLISPVGTFIGTWFSEELQFALSYEGVVIEPIDAYSYEKGHPFQKYINELYEMRVHAKKTNQVALARITKLLLNSLYGRFGMQLKRTETAYYTMDQIEMNIQKIADFSDDPFPGTNYHKVVLKTFKTIEQISKEFPNKTKEQMQAIYEFQGMGSKTCVAIASAVTAKARVHLKKIIRVGGLEPIYCDTDSITLASPIHYCDTPHCPLPSFCLPQGISSFYEDKQRQVFASRKVVGNELGQLKLETHFTEGYFLDVKCYMYLHADGTPETRFKGVPIAQRDTETIARLFKNHIKGEDDTYNFLDKTKNFVRNYDNMEITIKNFSSIPTRTLDYNKRNKVYNSAGHWVDTTPIVLVKPTYNEIL